MSSNPDTGARRPARRITHPGLRAAAYAQTKTKPGGDAPILVVVQLGTLRHCTNMCSHCERQGFHVLCGEKYGLHPDTLPVVPDAIIVRVEGPRTLGDVRQDFLALEGLRRAAPMTPLVLLADAAPSAEELVVVRRARAVILRKRNLSYDQLIATLHALISRSRN